MNLESKEHYRQIWINLALDNVKVATVDKILNNLDVAKASGVDQISAKFLKDGAPVIAI